jgi:hypothetical protein
MYPEYLLELNKSFFFISLMDKENQQHHGIEFNYMLILLCGKHMVSKKQISIFNHFFLRSSADYNWKKYL